MLCLECCHDMICPLSVNPLQGMLKLKLAKNATQATLAHFYRLNMGLTGYICMKNPAADKNEPNGQKTASVCLQCLWKEYLNTNVKKKGCIWIYTKLFDRTKYYASNEMFNVQIPNAKLCTEASIFVCCQAILDKGLFGGLFLTHFCDNLWSGVFGWTRRG